MNLNLSVLGRLFPIALLAVSLNVSAEKDTVRPAVGKPLQEAQKQLQAKNYKGALAAIATAEGVGNLTPYESFVTAQMKGSACAGAGDVNCAGDAFEKVLAAKRLPADQSLNITESLAGMYLRAKNFPKAIQWIDAYKDAGGTKPDTLSMLPQAYYFSGDFKKAATEGAAQITAAEKAGRTPTETQIQLLASSCIKQNDMVGYTGALEKMVRYYPKPEYWADLIQRTTRKPGFSGSLDIDMYRLLRATNNMTQAKDYMEMAQLSATANVPGEAKAVVDEAYEKKIFGAGDDKAEVDREARLKALIEKKYTTDKASIANTDKEVAAAPSGDPLVKQGFAYVTYGDYAKGLPMMEAGIKKGQLKAPEQAKLHLGYAYYLSGDKAKAQATLKTVGGTDGSADFARLWMIIAK